MEELDLASRQQKARKNRSLALGLTLFALAVLLYAITLVKLSLVG